MYTNCKAAVAQHQVQLDGIDAAILNLRDTYNSVRKPYEQLESRLAAQQAAHRALLEGFEGSIAQLLDVPLHPSLIAAIERSRNSESKSASQQSGSEQQPVAM